MLDEARWHRVVGVVQQELMTPVGLRSLARNSPDYKPTYDGDLRARDAAYHQGTVWSWLIGPFIDAWLKVHPKDLAGARVLEIQPPRRRLHRDGQRGVRRRAPLTPRGCAAQAWGVAELLRSLCRAR